MNKKHAANVMLALTAGVALGAGAEECRVTLDWAAVSSAEYRDGTEDLSAQNGWSMTPGVATVKDGVVCVSDENAAGSLDYEPSAPASALNKQTVEVHVPEVTIGDPPDAMPEMQGCLTVKEDSAGPFWCGWSAAGWTKLTGATPSEGEPCDIRMALDHAQGQVCYSVNQGGSWVELRPEGADTGWMAKDASGSALSGVAFKGTTYFTDVKMTQAGTLTVSAKLQERMAAQEISADKLDETAVNGNRNWENLVLGLDGRQENAQPVVLPVQTAAADTLTLKLGGVDVDAASGATVTYRVTASDEIGGAGTTTGPYNHDEQANVALPDAGAKYYRMSVTAVPGP